jgi:DNA-binding Lrp family transcriptional regulator
VARPPDVDKDRELIEILTAYARMPLAEIAKKLGVSRATLQSRLNRLERDGIIAGYTILLGKQDLNETALSAIVLIELEVKQQGSVIASLKKRAEVASCYSVSGQFDLFVTVTCATAADLDKTIDWIAGMEGVRRTTSSVLLIKKFER